MDMRGIVWLAFIGLAAVVVGVLLAMALTVWFFVNHVQFV